MFEKNQKNNNKLVRFISKKKKHLAKFGYYPLTFEVKIFNKKFYIFDYYTLKITQKMSSFFFVWERMKHFKILRSPSA
jgi:hypothetical protein